MYFGYYHGLKVLIQAKYLFAQNAILWKNQLTMEFVFGSSFDRC